MNKNYQTYIYTFLTNAIVIVDIAWDCNVQLSNICEVNLNAEKAGVA